MSGKERSKEMEYKKLELRCKDDRQRCIASESTMPVKLQYVFESPYSLVVEVMRIIKNGIGYKAVLKLKRKNWTRKKLLIVPMRRFELEI